MTGHCRFCGGVREVNARKQCVGCGMPAANAIVPESARKKSRLQAKCPQCRSPNADVIEQDRFCCQTCGTVYELLEQSFCDTRPEQNAMKNERR